MLSQRGFGAGVPSLVIDIRLLKRLLEDKYRFHLRRHFEEQFSMPGDGSEAPYHAKHTAKGYPSKLSDNLLVIWENQFDSISELGIIPRPLFRADLYNYLSSNSSKKTIFQRLDLRGKTVKSFPSLLIKSVVGLPRQFFVLVPLKQLWTYGWGEPHAKAVNMTTVLPKSEQNM